MHTWVSRYGSDTEVRVEKDKSKVAERHERSCSPRSRQGTEGGGVHRGEAYSIVGEQLDIWDTGVPL